MSNGSSDSGPVEAFVGVSEVGRTVEGHGHSLEAAIHDAAMHASKKGYAGEKFHAAVEIVPEEHNQWVKTYRVILTPDR